MNKVFAEVLAAAVNESVVIEFAAGHCITENLSSQRQKEQSRTDVQK